MTDELRRRHRKAHLLPTLRAPGVGDRRQAGVGVGAQFVDERRQRIGEVTVLASAVALALHGHGRAEALIFAVETGELPAVASRDDARREAPAPIVHLGVDALPVE